jgi:flagellar biosynthesis protein FlhG
MNDQAKKLRELAQKIREERNRATLIADSLQTAPVESEQPPARQNRENTRAKKPEPLRPSAGGRDAKRAATPENIRAYGAAAGSQNRASTVPAPTSIANETPRVLSEPAVITLNEETAPGLVRNHPRIIAVSSGKGGVGKSNLVANLGISLAMRGRNVIILDADLGMANIDVLFGINPKYNLQHLVDGSKSIHDILVSGPQSIKIVPGGSGIPELANLSDEKQQKIIEGFVDLDKEADVILVDTGAGISKDIIAFILAAREALIVTTPEPTAITDAYGLIKVLTQRDIDVDIKIVVNMVSSEREGREIADRIIMASKQFLNKQIKALGYIITDPSVNMSVRKQEPLLVLYPSSRASKCIKQIAANLDVPDQYSSSADSKNGLRGFLSRLLER